MRLYKYFILFVSLLFIFLKTQAQTDTTRAIKLDTLRRVVKPEPKREFRGVWVATVVNIDWPTQGHLSVEQQKQDLINILDADQRIGINAIMLQVRPAADAFYAKSLEPWSKWLTGQQGVGPSANFDPLQFAIEECHKRGMELHAWFNPYRATFDSNFKSLCQCHITNQQPSWFFTYGGIKLFDPGIPQVRDYIVKVILNVVDNYDIDGVHMDDYFYPYKIDGQQIKDAQTFKTYGGDFADINDWRRNNVDQLIKMLGDSIHDHKYYIKFGISPFGIWANKGHNPAGSDTHGLETYYELYADARKWMKEGWIDYVVPQLYRPTNDRLMDYNKLVDWWSDNTYGHHLYIGHAAYRALEPRSRAFQNPYELPNQIKYLRNNMRVQGSVFFSANSLMHNAYGFTDTLRKNYYRYPALPPVMLWLDSLPPNAPKTLTAKFTGNSVKLNWMMPDTAKDGDGAYGYVIYRFDGTEKVDLSDPKYILHIQYNTDVMYEDKTTQTGKTYLYVVTALDRMKNESDPTPTIAVSTNLPLTQKIN
jgi:uncharacterized lipoprotein YddW (UPF0748 family)